MAALFYHVRGEMKIKSKQRLLNLKNNFGQHQNQYYSSKNKKCFYQIRNFFLFHDDIFLFFLTANPAYIEYFD